MCVQSPEVVAFTVSNPAQVMEIGQSRDLGWCIGKTKRGTTCTNFINKRVAFLFFRFSYLNFSYLFLEFCVSACVLFVRLFIGLFSVLRFSFVLMRGVLLLLFYL